MDIGWIGLRGAIRGEDPYIDIHFNVYSSSVFNLDIGNNGNGRIKYQGAKLKDPPEVRTVIKQLERGIKARLTLRQWFSDAVMSRINQKGGKKITLDFGDLNISVEAKLPDGSVELDCRLPLPYTINIIIPTSTELEELAN